ncbi:MAG: hypothetical protein ACKVQU_25825 [Burkholderiales bacterium]
MKPALRRIQLPGRVRLEFAGLLRAGTMPWFDRLPELLGKIRTARFVEYADAGHAMHWQEPQRFALDLTRFVTLVAAGAAIA